jgi:hypothetical protein
MLPPTTQSGKEVLQSLTSLSKELKYYSDGFKATRKLRSTIAEIDQIKKGLRMAGQSTKQLEKQFSKTQKIVDFLNKDVKVVRKYWDDFLSKAGSAASAGKIVSESGKALAKFAPILTALAAVGIGIAVSEIQGWRADQNERGLQQLSRDVSKTLGFLNQQKQQIAAANKAVEKTNRDVDSLSKQFNPLKNEVKQAEKKANDSLYEVRQGRKILESLIAEARKLGNDALYEARQGRVKTDAQIQQQSQNFNQRFNELKNQFQNTINITGNGFQSALNTTISNVQREITSLKSSQVNKSDITAAIENNNRSIDAKIKANGDFLSNTFKPIQQAVNQLQTGVQTITQNGVTTKVFDGVIKSLNDTYEKSFEAQAKKFQEEQTKQSDLFLKQLKQGTATQNIIQDGIKAVDKQVNDFIRDIEKRTSLIETIAPEVEKLKQQVQSPDIQQEKRITSLETKIKELEKMDKEANKKLDILIPKIDSIIPTIAGIPLIPGKVINGIKPSIPTLPQIENATGTAMCRNLKTGCGKQAIDDAVSNINQVGNSNKNDLLDKLNTGLNAADLAQNTALLNTINNKLGDQVEGGISGKLGKAVKWLQLDRVLNVLTFAAAVHNGFQLTSDIAQTLGAALSNVLQVIGIKDDDGSPIDVGQIINSGVENAVKGIIGAENYKEMTVAWSKANRIYQSVNNVANSLTSATHTVLNGLEVVGGQTGKIGNALRESGEVLENAYQWMNPNPNYHSKVLNFLQNAQQGASTILQVTQVPIDVAEAITEVNESTTEMIKAVQQEPDTKQSKDIGDAKQVKEQQDEAKASSIGAAINIEDIFNAND